MEGLTSMPAEWQSPGARHIECISVDRPSLLLDVADDLLPRLHCAEASIAQQEQQLAAVIGQQEAFKEVVTRLVESLQCQTQAANNAASAEVEELQYQVGSNTLILWCLVLCSGDSGCLAQEGARPAAAVGQAAELQVVASCHVVVMRCKHTCPITSATAPRP